MYIYIYNGPFLVFHQADHIALYKYNIYFLSRTVILYAIPLPVLVSY